MEEWTMRPIWEEGGVEGEDVVGGRVRPASWTEGRGESGDGGGVGVSALTVRSRGTARESARP